MLAEGISKNKRPLVELDEDQSLPDNVCEYDDGKDFTTGYKLAQQDMLRANFRRIKEA